MHPASGQWWRYVRSADSAFICPFRKISVARDRSEGPNYPPAQVGLQSPTCQLGMVLSATQSLEWDSLLRECIGCSYSVLIDFGAAIVSENDWNVDCAAKYKLKSIYPQNARKPWEIPTSQGCKNCGTPLPAHTWANTPIPQGVFFCCSGMMSAPFHR